MGGFRGAGELLASVHRHFRTQVIYLPCHRAGRRPPTLSDTGRLSPLPPCWDRHFRTQVVYLPCHRAGTDTFGHRSFISLATVLGPTLSDTGRLSPLPPCWDRHF